MNDHIQALQGQVNDLYVNINALRNDQVQYPLHPALAHSDSPETFGNVLSPSQPRGSHPQFRGPTSSAFNFDVAKSSLQTMGITQPEVSDEGVSNDLDPALGAQSQYQAPFARMVTHSHKDPIWQLSKDEVIRLCKLYEEEMGIMYPMLDTQKTIGQADLLFSFIESAIRTGLVNRSLPGPDSLGSTDVYILKMMLATALTVEGCGQSELGRTLYESCRESFESILSRPVEIKGLILLVLVVGLHSSSFLKIF